VVDSSSFSIFFSKELDIELFLDIKWDFKEAAQLLCYVKNSIFNANDIIIVIQLVGK